MTKRGFEGAYFRQTGFENDTDSPSLVGRPYASNSLNLQQPFFPAARRGRKAVTTGKFLVQFFKKLAAGVILVKIKANSAAFMDCFYNHEEHEAPFGLHEGGWTPSPAVHGRSPSANVMSLRNEGSEHLRTWVPRAQPLAAGGIAE